MGNLTSITLPDSLTSIGYAAFSGCRSLTSIILPDNLSSIGSGAFSTSTVIIATSGSYAQSWAEENGYTFQPKAG